MVVFLIIRIAKIAFQSAFPENCLFLTLISQNTFDTGNDHKPISRNKNKKQKTKNMKTTLQNIIRNATAVVMITASSFVQAQTKQSAAVLNIDSRIAQVTPVELGNIVRLELQQLNHFNVIDKYDAEYIINREKLVIDKCYGRLCLIEMGKSLGVDKMIGGSYEMIEKKIIVSLSLVDVKTGSTEKTFTKEYLGLNKELRLITRQSLKQLLGIPIDEKELITTTSENAFPNKVNVQEEYLKLSGPRFGVMLFTGASAYKFQSARSAGGYDAPYPGVWQFGYQFEKQYLNTGNIQVLFEFIPMVNGLDQGLFQPTFTVLHGIRSNKNGLEFAFGPTMRISKLNPNNRMLDSKGVAVWNSDFVLAVGRSFRSGKMNIPVNVFFIPNRNGHRFGLSFGFNISKINPKNN